jgi:CheY-like chemotaxis protein
MGRGSTFWVDLPRAEPPSAKAPETDKPEPVPVLNRAQGKRTILYIEDNLSNLNLVQEILRQQPQVELLSAMQGRLGLDLARKHSPDLILLDLHLPDLTGGRSFRNCGVRRQRETSRSSLSAPTRPTPGSTVHVCGCTRLPNQTIGRHQIFARDRGIGMASTDFKTLIQKPNENRWRASSVNGWNPAKHGNQINTES